MWTLEELASALSRDEVGNLVRIERIRRKASLTPEDLLDGSDLEILRLELSAGDLCFLCRGETDALELSAIPGDWDRPYIEDQSSQAPWAELVGRPLFSVWQVLTIGGHLDGFQLEFGPAESLRRIQFDGAASTVRCFEVRPMTA